jgi:hypothetical protein
MDILFFILFSLLFIGLISILIVVKFDKIMSIKESIIKKDK